jgi:uncharacterized membrane protein YeaQ/YmgE (transglycosylase-associated protein family)
VGHLERATGCYISICNPSQLTQSFWSSVSSPSRTDPAHRAGMAEGQGRPLLLSESSGPPQLHYCGPIYLVVLLHKKGCLCWSDRITTIPSTDLIQRLREIKLNYVLGVLVGVAAGAIADDLPGRTKGDLSLNILLGVAGAILGMQIAEALEVPVLGQYGDEIAAVLEAIFILTGWPMCDRLRVGKSFLHARGGAVRAWHTRCRLHTQCRSDQDHSAGAPTAAKGVRFGICRNTAQTIAAIRLSNASP